MRSEHSQNGSQATEGSADALFAIDSRAQKALHSTASNITKQKSRIIKRAAKPSNEQVAHGNGQ